jgi:hypothetical protein
MTDDVMRAKTGEQLVYLVWEAKQGRATLAVICTSDDVLDRYVTLDRKNFRIALKLSLPLKSNAAVQRAA